MLKARVATFVILIALLLVAALAGQTSTAPAASPPSGVQQPGQTPTDLATPCPYVHCGPTSESVQVPTVPPQTLPDSYTKPLIDPKEPSVLGELQIITINSKVYKNIRNLRVWLPANYFAPVNRNKRYPVLYMQDGQNLFDEATAFNHEWRFDETVQFLTGSMMIHPMIVVGIDNTPRRANEYLPYPDADNKELGKYETQDVHGKQYGDFVINEVMPLIQKKYRVLLGPHDTGIGGSSYGGVASLYAVLAHPGVFGKALIESPPLLIGNKQLLKDAEKATRFPERMYIAMGTAEDPDEKASAKDVDAVQELEKILRAKGLGPTKLKVVIEEGAKHNEIAWSKRLQGALLFLYGSDIHLIPAK
jgi:predicted alpha/beta superfamily hydrolase